MSVSRLIASDNALRALLLLEQRAGGMRASEVAAALGISYTGSAKALGILVTDGLVDVADRRYAFATSARAGEAVLFGMAFLPADIALASLARGNDAVEFAAVDARGSIVVFRRFSDPAAEGRMRDAVERLRRFAPNIDVEFIRKEDLREELRGDLTPRRRAQEMRILAGTIDRTFPDRTHHGTVGARSLGRLNEAIAAPSARRLRRLGRDYGLRRIVAFGSATRVDFRPDSDIDLLVEPEPGHRLGLRERVALMADVERLFDRDVDLLIAPVRHASLARQIGQDGVVLLDAAR